jgi:hypothetical protein
MVLVGQVQAGGGGGACNMETTCAQEPYDEHLGCLSHGSHAVWPQGTSGGAEYPIEVVENCGGGNSNGAGGSR